MILSMRHDVDNRYHILSGDAVTLCVKVENPLQVTVDSALTTRFTKKSSSIVHFSKIPIDKHSWRWRATYRVEDEFDLVSLVMESILDKIIEHYTNTYLTKLIVE